MPLKQRILIISGFGLCFSILGFMACWGWMALKENSLQTYAAELEGQNQQLKIDSIQKDIDYLSREKCKNIFMRVMNINNEVKDVHFVGFGAGPSGGKTITIVVDGLQKDFDYNALMSRVFSVECSDDFAW